MRDSQSQMARFKVLHYVRHIPTYSFYCRPSHLKPNWLESFKFLFWKIQQGLLLLNFQILFWKKDNWDWSSFFGIICFKYRHHQFHLFDIIIIIPIIEMEEMFNLNRFNPAMPNSHTYMWLLFIMLKYY